MKHHSAKRHAAPRASRSRSERPKSAWKVELRGQTRDQLLARVVTFIAFTIGGMHAPARLKAAAQRHRPDDPANLVAWANDLQNSHPLVEAVGARLCEVDFLPPDGQRSRGWRAELLFDG